MSSHRLAPPAGRMLDREQPVTASFDGHPLGGYRGDTLMSALMARGRHLVARSPVRDRPRGPLTLTGLDGVLVESGGAAVPADRLWLRDGLTATARTAWGSLTRPPGRVRRAVARAAGLAPRAGAAEAAGAERDGERLAADVAVIGGGPAGLAAAAEAARQGAHVALVDDQPALGGSLRYGRWGEEPGAGDTALERLRVELTNRSNVRLITGTACTAWQAGNRLTLDDGARRPRLDAPHIVTATGALEQPLVVRGNDLPGVMTGAAVQRAIRLWGVKPGDRAVVCTVNPQGYAAALDLHDAGVEVAAVVDLNEDHCDCVERRACERRKLRILPGHTVYEARPAKGGQRLGSVVIDALADHEGDVSFATETDTCDLLAVSVGTAPLADIPVQAGAALVSDTYTGTALLEDVPPGLHPAGALTGAHDLDRVLADGRRAGWTAARDAGVRTGEAPDAPRGERPLVDHPWPIFPHPKGGEIVDRDADLTVADIRAAAEGAGGIDAALRAVGVGTGPSRGRVSMLHALRLAARARGLSSGGHVLPAPGTGSDTQPPDPAPRTAGGGAG